MRTARQQKNGRGIAAAFFNVGDLVMMGKFLNVPAKIVAFHDDGRGNPLVELQPLNKSPHKTKTIALFKIRRAPLATRLAVRYLKCANWMPMNKKSIDLIGARVAEQYIQAADDMEAILLKLRKGVTTPIESIGKLKKVLDHLGGWNIEPCIGIVHVLYETDFVSKVAAEVAELHAYARKHEVASLPVSPRADAIYVMDITDVRAAPGAGPEATGFEFKLWVGAAGFRITSPEGKTFEVLPEHNVWRRSIKQGDFRNLAKLGPKPATKFIRSFGYVTWLKKETSFSKQVLDALGMEEHQPGAQRTRNNTGSCGGCFRNVKLKASGGLPTVVNHGFTRPGWGSIQGNCISAGFPPFELSPEGTKHLVKVLILQQEKLRELLAQIDAGTLDILFVVPGDVRSLVRLGDRGWNKGVETAKRKFPDMIKSMASDIKPLERLIADWKERPLPAEGAIVQDWQFRNH
jgi:hypothetical protein